MRHRTTALAALALLGASLGGMWGPAGASDGAFTAPDPYYVDIAAEAGLDFECQHWDKSLGFAPRWFVDIFFCASPVLADFNGDGFTDIYFPNMRYNVPLFNEARDPQDALYLNHGDGTFRDVGSLVGIHDNGYSMGAAAIDFDNDGDLDIAVMNYPEVPYGFNNLYSPATVFYVNNGDGTFTKDVPPGLETEFRFSRDDGQFGMAVAVADYDLDGDLDLFRGNYAQYAMTMGMPPSLQNTQPDTNNFFVNNGDGTFTDRTADTGAARMMGRTFAVNFVDFDGDGYPDLYVANDENPNELYLNRPDPVTGERVFLDFSSQSFASDGRGAMCSSAQDTNNDGHLDLYMSHYEDEHNGYYLGNGDGTFVEHSTMGDLGKAFHYLGWACPFFDMDNDGDRDLYVANGHMVPAGGEFFHPGDPEDDNGYALPNFLFRNMLAETGSLDWVDYRKSAGPGLLDRFVSGGVNTADLDFDGKQEILVVNNNAEPVQLYRNEATGLGHWVSMELRGTSANSHAIGAKVVVESGGSVQHAQMMTGELLASGSVKPLHFGLGTHTGPVTVDVTWPGGATETYTLAADEHVRITQGQGVQRDTLAPRVDVGVAGTLGEEGWYTSPSLTVTLDAVERGEETSGVASLEYKLDNGPRQAYSGPITVTGEGRHTLWTYASDGAGNSAWYAQEFRIDSQAPELALQAPAPGWIYVQDRPLMEHPDGETVIIAPVRTPGESADLVDTVVYGVHYELTERYGVPLAPVPATVRETLDGTAGSDGMTTVSATSGDATSGVRDVRFSLDGEERRVDRAAPYDWLVDLRGQTLGEHTLGVLAEDHAGWQASGDITILVVPSTQDGVMNTLMGLLGMPTLPSIPGGDEA